MAEEYQKIEKNKEYNSSSYAFCSRCGNKLSGKGNFCPKCGNSVREVKLTREQEDFIEYLQQGTLQRQKMLKRLLRILWNVARWVLLLSCMILLIGIFYPDDYGYALFDNFGVVFKDGYDSAFLAYVGISGEMAELAWLLQFPCYFILALIIKRTFIGKEKGQRPIFYLIIIEVLIFIVIDSLIQKLFYTRGLLIFHDSVIYGGGMLINFGLMGMIISGVAVKFFNTYFINIKPTVPTSESV
ncbi:hypothetical protein [Enterococcus sp.]|uniref:hypothetical protein n=1 Tax=Enterococcus sp. TaxID=35783 RepID=UPI003C753543